VGQSDGRAELVDLANIRRFGSSFVGHHAYAAVHSDGCAVHDRLAGNKELAWIDNGTQTDFYDVPEYVKMAADRAAGWFEETL
jgi:fermentation-respiration switch protein FrsA (DUF1100 family)